MTKRLLTEPKQFITPAGTIVRHIYKVDHQVCCDLDGLANLLEASTVAAERLARKHDRLTVFEKSLFCTADDFAFLIDELPGAPLPAKKLASKIHKTSEMEMAYYFWFNQK